MRELVFIRYAVFAMFLAGAVIALAAWAVRTRQVSPFSALGRALRSISEPFVRPTEHWLLKRGGNPQNAAWWIFGIALIGGIVMITLATWIVGALAVASHTATSGRGIVRLIVYYTGQLILLALIIRVIGSWFGAFRFSKWMRPVYLITDWIIEPLRKIIPPVGMIDLTPLIAWFGIQIVLRWVMSVL
ncbi:MAG: YggT family protein [Gemmatimonadetes bacterium]|nr:YggT family protein [Gemmatimonadota bacterium]